MEYQIRLRQDYMIIYMGLMDRLPTFTSILTKKLVIVYTIVYTFNMDIEWNDDKNQLNIQKHGIDFCDVWRVFEAPMLIKQDNRQDYGETRWAALGKLEEAVVFVVYTIRHEKIRLISVRRANRHERKTYQEKFEKPH